MKKRWLECSIIIVFALIVSVSAVLIKQYRRYDSTNIVSKSVETAYELTTEAGAEYDAIISYVSSQYGVTLSEEKLENLDNTVISTMTDKISQGAIDTNDWYSLTGYTYNAFIDRFGTGESIDMGNNGKGYFELGFTGDINFTETGYVMTHANTKENGPLDCIDQVFQNEMKAVDIMLVNNEFPYSNKGTPLAGKKYTFRAQPYTVSYMKDMGVDIVSLANNHAYDYGSEAFNDTLAVLKQANIATVGAGSNIDEASKPTTFIINGYKVAYLACQGVEYPIHTPVATSTSEGIMGSYDNGAAMVAAIKKAKETCDYVIAYPHWGMENTTQLTNAQVSNARKYIDAGADVVIGNHSHCLQGMEFYNGKAIFYSLGNFWFNTKDVYTAMLKLKITDRGIEHTLIPGRQRNSETTHLESAEERRQLYNQIMSWQPAQSVTISDDGLITANK